MSQSTSEDVAHSTRKPTHLLGVLQGEGIGPEIVTAALKVGAAAASRFNFDFKVETGGAIGLEALKHSPSELSADVSEFCSHISENSGAVLSGPGGGRYVYELRRRFKLFCKINPLCSYPELDSVSRLKIKPGKPRPDIVLVRENLDGLYQGETRVSSEPHYGRVLEHTFYSRESHTRMLLDRACRMAAGRSGRLAVIVKRGALGPISSLWQDCAEALGRDAGVQIEALDIDFAAYRLLQNPEDFDIIAAPNCFGDILADLGGLLCSSRGLTYGSSFSASGFGVYQTNHGCAYDLAGTRRANPAGQIFSFAMLMRESWHEVEAADAIVEAVRRVWRQGIRTADIMEDGCKLAATDFFAESVAAALMEGART